jgi:ABC-type Fe3+-hydroxamate transport system substrate-binding protein
MPIFTDQLNRKIFLPALPKRIISIVPSQTELLFDLGLSDEIAGVTKFCIHPSDKVKSVAKIGGTKQLDIAKIKNLHPDLIIANKEENERAQVEELMTICPVWISDIGNLDEALEMIERVGALTGKIEEAATLIDLISKHFQALVIKTVHLRTAYFIWRQPYMVAGKGTFIDDMLQRCGLINAFDQQRYPEVDRDTIIALKPEVVLLSSEPYPFRQKHIDEIKTLLPDATIKLVDGEMFSWYGSRLLQAPAYLETVVKGLQND